MSELKTAAQSGGRPKLAAGRGSSSNSRVTSSVGNITRGTVVEEDLLPEKAQNSPAAILAGKKNLTPVQVLVALEWQGQLRSER